MKINLEKKDKIALGGAWVFIYIIGWAPALVAGIAGFIFKDQIRDYFYKATIKGKVEEAKTSVKKLWEKLLNTKID